MDLFHSIYMEKLHQSHYRLCGSPCDLKLNSVERIQLRMIYALFDSNPCTIIVSCYSPTNASDETDIIIF